MARKLTIQKIIRLWKNGEYYLFPSLQKTTEICEQCKANGFIMIIEGRHADCSLIEQAGIILEKTEGKEGNLAKDFLFQIAKQGEHKQAILALAQLACVYHEKLGDIEKKSWKELARKSGLCCQKTAVTHRPFPSVCI